MNKGQLHFKFRYGVKLQGTQASMFKSRNYTRIQQRKQFDKALKTLLKQEQQGIIIIDKVDIAKDYATISYGVVK